MNGFPASQYFQVVRFGPMAGRIAPCSETNRPLMHNPLPLVEHQGTIGAFLVCSVAVIKRPVLVPVDNFVGVQNLELLFQ